MSEYTDAKNMINEWLKNSPEKTITEKNNEEDKNSMAMLHVRNESFLGEIVGGYSRLSLCDGYFNILCGGGEYSIVDHNGLDEKGMPQLFPGALIIAYDISGNIFAINSGACREADMGRVLYLPKESFAWENLDLSYAQFLKWISGVTVCDLINNGWKSEKTDNPIKDFQEFLMGKAAAYNLFLKQDGKLNE